MPTRQTRNSLRTQTLTTRTFQRNPLPSLRLAPRPGVSECSLPATPGSGLDTLREFPLPPECPKGALAGVVHSRHRLY